MVHVPVVRSPLPFPSPPSPGALVHARHPAHAPLLRRVLLAVRSRILLLFFCFDHHQANTHATDLPGGMQADTNALEATNGAHKRFAERERLAASDYVGALYVWVEEKSVIDTSFAARMHSEVHSIAFYDRAAALLALEVSPMTVFFKAPPGIPGAIYITAEETLTSVRPALEFQGRTSVKDFKLAVSRNAVGTERGWLKQYADIAANPRVECRDMKFDEIIAWCSSFYLLRPFPPGPRLEELYFRLKNSKVPIIAYREVAALGNGGIMICNCPAFLQRCWCHHSFADAKSKGIITGYPATMAPGNLPRKK